jgi:hypothetical protein
MSLNQTLSHFYDLLDSCAPLLEPFESILGRYEADTTAMCLTRLVVRHASAVHDLCERGIENYASAAACARCAFETGATAAWLTIPEDPFDREGRWVGYFKSHERFYRKLAADFNPFAPEIAAELQRTADHHAAWKSAIENKLPSTAKVVVKPALPEILRELGFLKLYVAYRGISQVVHAEPESIDLIRRVEYIPADPDEAGDIFRTAGQLTRFGNFVNDKMWAVLIRMSTWGIMISLPRLLTRVEANCETDSLFSIQRELYVQLDRLEGTA